MVAFRRVYTQDPGLSTLLEIEQVAIIDEVPAGPQLGAGTGLVLCVGEFERGPLESPTRVFGQTDLFRRFGGLGWAVPGGLRYAGPVAQKSGGSEAWNGNGFIALANKRFSQLAVCRVDNSAGSVSFQRLACLLGGTGRFSSTPGATATFLLDGATPATATLNATQAQITGVGAVYPLVNPGGKTIIVEYDDNEAQIYTLQASDTTLTAVVNRINAQAAATIASASGGQLRLSSVRFGSRARIKIVGGNALADLGLPASPTPAVWTLTVNADLAASTQLRVSRFINGVATDFDTAAVPGPVGSVTAKRDALLTQLGLLGVPGATFASIGIDQLTLTADANVVITGFSALAGAADLTINNGTPAVVTEAFGTGNVGDSADFSAQEAATLIDAVANLSAVVTPSGRLRVCNELTPATGTIQGDAGQLLLDLGFDTTTVASAAAGADVVIPAGTSVQDSTVTGTIWVTMTDIQTGTGGGSWTAKVRPFYDTDTALASSPGNVTLLLDTLEDGFTVSNGSTITRLTAPQLDARYINAIRRTLADASPSRDVNYIFSARTSVAIRAELRDNALKASAEGLRGRKAIVSARLGTTVDQAVLDCTATRNERVQFMFPGGVTAINEIREVGAAGGVGFSDDGLVQVRMDSYIASARSILLPELNAGQDLSQTNVGPLNVLALEDAYNPEVEGATILDRETYTFLKAQGITALRLDRITGAFFQSDVTSVLPTVSPTLTDANRRAFADFINDSLADIGVRYSKLLGTPENKRSLRSDLSSFLDLLKSSEQPKSSRLVDYSVTDQTDPSVPDLWRFSVRVRMYGTAKTIVFQTSVSPNEVISQELAA